MENKRPTLYLIPVELSTTSPADVLPSANFEVASRLKYFIVENVRSARRFLRRCDRTIDIDSLTFFTLNEHTRREEIADMLRPMEEGNDMGVISEAGCPAIADPGADVVALAQRRGYNISPLVGPSSILLALMASGFNGQSFAFNGYLPIAPAERTAKLKELYRRAVHDDQSQIFIETPYRNNRLVADIVNALPHDALLCVASDITGPNQSIRNLPLSRWAATNFDYNKTPTIFLIYHP
ncbi:MAG: SAM-dependent methyltransferase [Muribaculaceae bacterium]|nr:SAM-dependent methyltransferase [Muribaculaceae bacterium]